MAVPLPPFVATVLPRGPRHPGQVDLGARRDPSGPLKVLLHWGRRLREAAPLIPRLERAEHLPGEVQPEAGKALLPSPLNTSESQDREATCPRPHTWQVTANTAAGSTVAGEGISLFSSICGPEQIPHLSWRDKIRGPSEIPYRRSMKGKPPSCSWALSGLSSGTSPAAGHGVGMGRSQCCSWSNPDSVRLGRPLVPT